MCRYVSRPIVRPRYNTISTNSSCFNINYWSPCNRDENICFSISKLCVYSRSLNGDPLYCPNTDHLPACLLYSCPTYFKCKGSFCIPLNMVCDTIEDCPNGEDELACKDFTCNNLIKCKHDNICIHPHQVCDNVVDCMYSADDETFCDFHDCPAGCECFKYTIICTDVHINSHNDIRLHIYRAVIVRNSDIQKFQFISAKAITYLDISKNRIDPVSLKTICAQSAYVQTLDVSHNELSYLISYTFQGLIFLSHLNIQNNPIVFIQAYAFDDLPSIKFLDFNSIGLSSIQQAAFSKMENIQFINFSHNSLTAINDGWFRLPTTFVTDVRFNPIAYMHVDSKHQTSKNVRYIIDLSQRALCCFQTHSIPLCSQLHNLSKVCKLVVSTKFILTMLFVMAIINGLINISVILYTILFLAHNPHFLFVWILATCDILYSCYIIIIIQSHYAYGTTFVFHINQWLEGVRYKIAGFVLLIGFLIPKYVSCLIYVNQVLLIKYALRCISLNFKQAIILFITGILVLASVAIYIILTHTGDSIIGIPFNKWQDSTLYEKSAPIIILSITAFSQVVSTSCQILNIISIQESAKKVNKSADTMILKVKCVLSSLISLIQWLGIVIYIYVPNDIFSDEHLIVFVIPLSNLLNPFLHTFLSTSFRRFICRGFFKV